MLEYNRERLGIDEYIGHIYENISKIIINQSYINENINFFEKLLFKMWEQYYYSTIDPISINKQLSILEMFLATMIELKPSQSLPEDVV